MYSSEQEGGEEEVLFLLTPARIDGNCQIRDLNRLISRYKKPRATAYFPTPRGAVSSALKRFTAVFGMGTGGATSR